MSKLYWHLTVNMLEKITDSLMLARTRLHEDARRLDALEAIAALQAVTKLLTKIAVLSNENEDNNENDTKL